MRCIMYLQGTLGVLYLNYSLIQVSLRVPLGILSGDIWVFYLEYVPRNIARYLVYKGFGNFSIILYIYTWGGGRLPALPFGFPLLIAGKKKLSPKIQLGVTLGSLGYHLGKFQVVQIFVPSKALLSTQKFLEQAKKNPHDFSQGF